MASENSERITFLVVDHNRESRFLLVKTLLRKYPGCVIHETDDPEQAVTLAQRGGLTAIISHRTSEMLGVELVARFREVDLKVPIVMVSGIERTGPALRAGADCFLLYDEWLRIGTVVEQLLAHPRAHTELKVVEVDFKSPP
jgi:CheY-like chemotaxis protein